MRDRLLTGAVFGAYGGVLFGCFAGYLALINFDEFSLSRQALDAVQLAVWVAGVPLGAGVGAVAGYVTRRKP